MREAGIEEPRNRNQDRRLQDGIPVLFLLLQIIPAQDRDHAFRRAGEARLSVAWQSDGASLEMWHPRWRLSPPRPERPEEAPGSRERSVRCDLIEQPLATLTADAGPRKPRKVTRLRR